MNNKNNNVYGFGPYNMFFFNFWRLDKKDNDIPIETSIKVTSGKRIANFLSIFAKKEKQIVNNESNIDMHQTIEIPIENSTKTYIINKNNTLTYPDGHTETIFSAETCGSNPSSCFKMTPGTSYSRNQPERMRFGKTIKTLEFYKKTKTHDNEDAITTLIVPTDTDIYFSNPSLSNQCKKRVSKAIVRNNILLKTNTEIPKTRSLLDLNFNYETNSIVTPKNGFDDYGEWIYDGYPSSASGLHIFSTKEKAKEYEY
jgi:hypothetical protein